MQKKIHLIFIPMILIFIALGIWQVQRYYEKLSFSESVTKSDRSEIKIIKDQQDIEIYSIVKLEGRIDNNKILWLYRRHPFAKGQDGAYLLAKISTGFNVEYPVILGWVNNAHFGKILENLKGGLSVSIKALVLPSENKSILIPDNNYQKKICFTMNMDEINQELDIINSPNYFLAALGFGGEMVPKIYPIYSEMMIRIPNHHLEYASMWFCFAVCLVIFIFASKSYGK